MEESKEKEYSFINEIIIPKKKNKWLVRLETLMVVIVMAIVFGFVARGVFLISDGVWKKWLGIEEYPKIELSTGVTIENSVMSLTEEQVRDVQIYDIVNQVTHNIENSIVSIKMEREKIDLFQETYMVNVYTTGLILYKNDTDLFILANKEKIFEEDAITVCFGKTELSGTIYSSNKEYGFVIISVKLSTIPKELLETIIVAKFSEEKLTSRSRIVALGRPNGYQDSIEVGMITSLGDAISIVDGEIPYFTTNIVDNNNGSGFIFNLNGQVIGMITHTYKKDINDGISSAIALNDIKNVIISSLNPQKPVVSFGIKGTALPEGMKLILNSSGEVKRGIYVVGVQSSSTAFYLGIKAGDIILSINGEKVDGMTNFKDILLKHEVGEIIQIEYLAQSEETPKIYVVEVRLAEKK